MAVMLRHSVRPDGCCDLDDQESLLNCGLISPADVPAQMPGATR